MSGSLIEIEAHCASESTPAHGQHDRFNGGIEIAVIPALGGPASLFADGADKIERSSERELSSIFDFNKLKAQTHFFEKQARTT